MEYLSNTELVILDTLEPALIGVYLSWRLLNKRIEDLKISRSTRYRYKTELNRLFNINVSQKRVQTIMPLVEKEEIPE